MKLRKNIMTVFSAALLLLGSGCQNQEQKPMEKSETPVIDAIMARRSIRQYKDTPVSRDLLQKLAECGVNAPNAMNKQEWEVRIVNSQDYLNGVTELMKADMPFFVKADDPKFRNAFRNATAIIAVGCPDDPTGMTRSRPPCRFRKW